MADSHLASKISNEAIGDARWTLIERIAASQHFKSSARLRDFLFYIADCSIRGAPDEATEQQIGIRVFQRTPGYNSSEDSIVRTHARLLRQRLASYFSEEGLNEETVVEIPKGHYLPVFRPRVEQPVAPLMAEPAQVLLPIDVLPAKKPSRTSKRIGILGGITLILLLVGLGVLFLWHPWRRPSPPQVALNKFWRPFFADDPPLVIFSNALFIGDSTHGLRYAPTQGPENAQATDTYVDTYTGVGELSSVYVLTRLFDSHQAHFTLKRSMLMAWDEAKTKNLIFIGSVAENPSLRVLQSTKDFTMIAQPSYAAVVNNHPKTGEPALYSRSEHPLTKDYAILALLPGVQPGKHTLIFSGLMTFGTQAAVDYLCSPDDVAELLRQITDPKGEIHPFEAVLETTIGGGVPLQTRLVTVRVH